MTFIRRILDERSLARHVWSWDLFVVVATIVLVKPAVLAWPS